MWSSETPEGGVWGVSTNPILYTYFLFSHRQFSYWLISSDVAVFLYSKFFTMSKVTLTTNTPPAIVMCVGALTMSTTATMAPISGTSSNFESPYVVMLPLLIWRDKMRGVFASSLCYSSNLSSRSLVRLMPIMTWVLLRRVFSFRVNPLKNFCMLVSVTMFAYSFGVLMWLPSSAMWP